MRLTAARFCRTVPELLAFLESTLTGKWVWAEMYPIDEIEFRIRAAVNRCIDAGMILCNEEGVLEATPFGLATASKGISIATARTLEHWIVQSETRDWSGLDLLYAVLNAPDGLMLQVMLTTREYETRGLSRQAQADHRRRGTHRRHPHEPYSQLHPPALLRRGARH